MGVAPGGTGVAGGNERGDSLGGGLLKECVPEGNSRSPGARFAGSVADGHYLCGHRRGLDQKLRIDFDSAAGGCGNDEQKRCAGGDRARAHHVERSLTGHAAGGGATWRGSVGRTWVNPSDRGGNDFGWIGEGETGQSAKVTEIG